jgi:hypothetical protein
MIWALGLQGATMMTWQCISSRNSQVVCISDYQIGFMIDYTKKKKKRGWWDDRNGAHIILYFKRYEKKILCKYYEY